MNTENKIDPMDVEIAAYQAFIGEHDSPLKEYPQREIYAYGRYIQCQILNWDKGEPPRALICHPLHKDYREDFLAMQGMGTWMRVDLRDALRLLELQPPHPALIDACRDCLADRGDWVPKMTAAIAKATGNSP